MNPYDFVPIDWNNPPERHRPLQHDRFSEKSGKIEGTITAETPIFIFPSPKSDHEPHLFIKNNQGKHIIPGSSLKGLFRNLVETIGNGCFLLFDKKYNSKLPSNFKKCNTDNLCIACRMFGRIPDRGDNSNLHRGKVSFNDAVEIDICTHNPVYTIVLMGPKPHHSAFYLDPNGQRIAGRKFYFHQHEIQTESKKTDFNQYITPIDKGSQFAFSAQFTNLEDIELQTLLYALELKPNMRHKLGYGKPAGFGSVRFEITKLTLIDYAQRYTAARGTEYIEGNRLEAYLSQQTRQFRDNTTSKTLNALRRIWRWDPNDETQYRYPNHAWFGENSKEPISRTP